MTPGGGGGVSTKCASEVLAEAEALSKCQALNKWECCVASTCTNQCLAIGRPYRQGLGNYSFQRGLDLEEVSARALDACKESSNCGMCGYVFRLLSCGLDPWIEEVFSALSAIQLPDEIL